MPHMCNDTHIRRLLQYNTAKGQQKSWVVMFTLKALLASLLQSAALTPPEIAVDANLHCKPTTYYSYQCMAWGSPTRHLSMILGNQHGTSVVSLQTSKPRLHSGQNWFAHQFGLFLVYQYLLQFRLKLKISLKWTRNFHHILAPSFHFLN